MSSAFIVADNILSMLNYEPLIGSELLQVSNGHGLPKVDEGKRKLLEEGTGRLEEDFTWSWKQIRVEKGVRCYFRM